MIVKNITIVGGGTASWLTAAYLYKNQPSIKITVVDKEVGNPIGVGEASLLSFKPFMAECGFDEKEWMVATDAGYKSAILFANWQEEGNNIWHPFYKGNKNVVNNLNIWNLWSLNQDLDFKKYALGLYDSSVLHNSVDFDQISSYGYHVDCGKLVVYIQNYLKDKINIIRSDVVEVVKSNGESIDLLRLKDGQEISSDLYVDCTGFNQVLGKSDKRINLDDRLFVNTAVACPVPYQDKSNEFKPYAVCEAVDHGWIWKIGVDSRIGSGMVFNRNITSIDEAKKYFVQHWNNRIDEKNVRVINWDPYYIEDQWRGNIVNIGLSAGFIEPLESTGIGLITVGITQLNNAIQENYYSTRDQDYFNCQLNTLFEDCVDFVSMHYANNFRTSNFWKHVKNTFAPSDRMIHQLSMLDDPNTGMPFSGKYNYMFGGANWTTILQQLGYSVAPRNILINKETARELVIKNYMLHEKNRHVSSRHHSSEIAALKEEHYLLK